MIASHLSASAKKQAFDSIHRQREMERLYTLSRNLLLLDTRGPLTQQIINQIAQVFELPGVAFFDRAADVIRRSGPQDIPVDDSKLRDAALQGTVFLDATAHTTVMPISLGGQPIGSLGIQGSRFPRRLSTPSPTSPPSPWSAHGLWKWPPAPKPPGKAGS